MGTTGESQGGHRRHQTSSTPTVTPVGGLQSLPVFFAFDFQPRPPPTQTLTLRNGCHRTMATVLVDNFSIAVLRNSGWVLRPPWNDDDASLRASWPPNNYTHAIHFRPAPPAHDYHRQSTLPAFPRWQSLHHLFPPRPAHAPTWGPTTTPTKPEPTGGKAPCWPATSSGGGAVQSITILTDSPSANRTWRPIYSVGYDNQRLARGPRSAVGGRPADGEPGSIWQRQTVSAFPTITTRRQFQIDHAHLRAAKRLHLPHLRPSPINEVGPACKSSIRVSKPTRSPGRPGTSRVTLRLSGWTDRQPKPRRGSIPPRAAPSLTNGTSSSWQTTLHSSKATPIRP